MGIRLYKIIGIDLIYWAMTVTPALMLVLKGLDQNQQLFVVFVVLYGISNLFFAPLLQELCIRIYLDQKPFFDMSRVYRSSNLSLPPLWPYSKTTNDPRYRTGRRSQSIFSFTPVKILERLDPGYSADEYIDRANSIFKNMNPDNDWPTRRFSYLLLGIVMIVFAARFWFPNQTGTSNIDAKILLVCCLPLVMVGWEIHLLTVFTCFLDAASAEIKAKD